MNLKYNREQFIFYNMRRDWCSYIHIHIVSIYIFFYCICHMYIFTQMEMITTPLESYIDISLPATIYLGEKPKRLSFRPSPKAPQV